ncbi:DUF362 domain-containing protein [Candidatus Latescibacterota bacterium]
MKIIIKYRGLLQGRREFAKTLTLGSAGIALSQFINSGCAPNVPKIHKTGSLISPELGTKETSVSLMTGTDRRQMVYDSLIPFEEHLQEAIKDKQVVVKVNLMGPGNPLCTTHPDAVRGLLDFLKPIYDRPVIVFESKGFEPNFEHFGYFPLKKEYNIKMMDLALTRQPMNTQFVLNENLLPEPIRIFDAYIDPNNYIISLAQMKTSGGVIATLGLKNVAMGAPVKIRSLNVNDKGKMHAAASGTPKLHNFNIFLMAHRTHPHFSIVDGVVSMEGNGPIKGTPVEHNVVFSGPDFVAVDRIGIELMGIEWEKVGYLQYCSNFGLGQGDRSKINIIGANPKDHVIAYKMSDKVEWQYSWDEDISIIEKED